MKLTAKREYSSRLFTEILDNLSKLFYKMLMTFTEFQHRLDVLDNCLKYYKPEIIVSLQVPPLNACLELFR